MISEETFNKTRDELFKLMVAVAEYDLSFGTFSNKVEEIRINNNVPRDEMLILLNMILNSIDGEEDAE